MTRKALIIVCPGKEGDRNYLAGTIVDSKKYKDFLYSRYGGDWYYSEISVLTNPTKEDVKNQIKAIDTDYSFIVFSGHGGVGNTDNRMYVDVEDGELYIGELKTKSKKQTLIIDSCRTIFPQIFNEALSKAFSDSTFGETLDSRQLFDNHLSICEDGIITVYACKKNQAAGDNASVGGLFSSSLIKAGRSFGKTKGSPQILDIHDAFDAAVQIMDQDFITIQEPEFEAGRRRHYFPFAVRKSR